MFSLTKLAAVGEEVSSHYVAQGIVVDKDNFYSYAEISCHSSSKLSRRIAYAEAETKALNNLITHIKLRNVVVPPSLEPFRSQLLLVISKEYLPEVSVVEGVQVISRNCDLEKVWCRICVPKGSFGKEQPLTGTVDELIINRSEKFFDRMSLPLYYEVISLNHKDFARKNLGRWLNKKKDIVGLNRSLNGELLLSIPSLWWSGNDCLPIEQVQQESNHALLCILNEGVYLNWCHEIILNEFKIRGYHRFSKQLSVLLNPILSFNENDRLLRLILARVNIVSDKILGEPFLNTLRENKEFLPLFDDKEKGLDSEELSEAMQLFFGKNTPDLNKVYALCLRSVMKTPTSDAFNLMGRCLDLQDKDDSAILLLYGQAQKMNPQHPFVAANIALFAKKKGLIDLAKLAASMASENKNLAPWAKKELTKNELLK